MVRAGEVGGMLEVVLQRLAIFMERRQALKRRVKGAMIYPIAVLVIAAGIVCFLLTYMVPVFAEIFEDFGAKLPAMTMFLIDVGDFMPLQMVDCAAVDQHHHHRDQDTFKDQVD